MSYLLIPSFLMIEVSNSLRLLLTNERMSKLLFFLANRSFALLLTKNEQFAHSLFFNDRCERIAQVAHQKCANEQITHFFEQIAYSLIFSQKMSDSLRKLMSKFPILCECACCTPEKTGTNGGAHAPLCTYTKCAC